MSLINDKIIQKLKLRKYILSLLTTFLNTSKEAFYKGSREALKKQLHIPDTQVLYYNGYSYKPMIYINAQDSLEYIEIPIRRLLWVKEYGEKVHIYIYPSFALKYCPFPLNDVERVYVDFLSRNIEPFNVLNDPRELLDSSLPYETWAKRIGSILKEKDFQTQWTKLFYNTFYSLLEVQTDKDFLMQCLELIKKFINRLNMKNYSKNILLSYANFQLPFR